MSTRALVLYAHPCPESLCAALRGVVLERLGARGWAVDDCDLHAAGFDPVLSQAERRGYHDTAANRLPVASSVDRVLAAEALVLVFPVWNFGFPAILKGLFDRVFLPGVSFRLEGGRVRPNLARVRRLAAVTTYGGTRARAMLAGDPPRRVVTRALWHVTRPERTRHLALYDMNGATAARRERFLGRVVREMAAL